ncbi:hypothetical protein HK405_003858, partial [Cladochytrium tenue]
MSGNKKKDKKVVMHISEFLSSGSWADDVEQLPSGPASVGSFGDLPTSGGGMDRDRAVVFPDRPPYTAFVGNLSFDITDDDLYNLFKGLKVKSVRLQRGPDDRPKGFGYCEFDDLDSLKAAVNRHGESVRGRSIRIDVSEPREAPKRHSSYRDDLPPSASEENSDWRRREAPAGGAFGDRRGGGGGFDDRRSSRSSYGGDFERRDSDRSYGFDRDRGYGGDRDRGFGGDRDRGFGGFRPFERKRLELKPRTVDDGAPATSDGPSSPVESSGAGDAPRRPKPNPFGEAKPRDENEVMRRFEERHASTASSTSAEHHPKPPSSAGSVDAARKPRPNPFGEAKPRDENEVLRRIEERHAAEKKSRADSDAHAAVDETEAVTTRTASPVSRAGTEASEAAPSVATSSAPEGPKATEAAAPKKPKANPFGAAKPRDENEIMRKFEERQREKAAEAATRKAAEAEAKKAAEAAEKEARQREEEQKQQTAAESQVKENKAAAAATASEAVKGQPAAADAKPVGAVHDGPSRRQSTSNRGWGGSAQHHHRGGGAAGAARGRGGAAGGGQREYRAGGGGSGEAGAWRRDRDSAMSPTGEPA